MRKRNYDITVGLADGQTRVFSLSATDPATAEAKFRRALRVNGEMTIVSVVEGGPVTEDTVRIV